MFRSCCYAGPWRLVVVLALTVVFSLPVGASPDFSGYDSVEARKQAFFEYFLPLVKERNREILETREKLVQWRQRPGSVEGWSRDRVEAIVADYEVSDFDPDSERSWQRLLRRVDVIPPSLALAQAAKESGWGQSRFARQGNNYFGQWCFEKGCGLVPRERGSDSSHEVAVFSSAEESVDAYMRNLNRHPAYSSFRALRARMRQQDEPISGAALADGLEDYSARGEKYVTRLRDLIRFNELSRHDRES
ncbi:MAG: glucosaminidase domain-containing protein [Marinobacter sp.]|uniref:glucosaminidase domain-containing protein n=1 Tax=Marinobacter sp. TaxID=50741 RepID=UPI00299D4FAA|nr:glucosaminidase domain-containing protein [Marinobacter sp.]MDX1633699.1 glucosaminidase domain-containing protein [Marinobacter sp.]